MPGPAKEHIRPNKFLPDPSCSNFLSNFSLQYLPLSRVPGQYKGRFGIDRQAKPKQIGKAVMAAEVARQRPISPTEVEDTSGSFGGISPRHNSTTDSIVVPQDFFDPNGPRQHNSGGYSGPAGGPNTNLETYEHDSLSRVNSPPVIAGPSTEPRLAVAASDRGNRSDTEGLIIRTPSERGSSVLPTTMPIPQPVDGTHREPWWNRPRFAWTKKGRWCFILTPLSICLIIALVVVVVVWQASEGGGGRDVSVSLSTLTTVTIPQSSALPRANSGLGATTDDLATVFSSTNTSTSETILAYIDTASASPRLCIRKKSDTAWLSNVLCITDKDVNPKSDSPVTVLDWIGGPSVFFVTEDDKLGGIDWVPHSSSWKMSNLVAQKREVSKRSQLASVTWLNGTSAWLYVSAPSATLMATCRVILMSGVFVVPG